MDTWTHGHYDSAAIRPIDIENTLIIMQPLKITF